MFNLLALIWDWLSRPDLNENPCKEYHFSLVLRYWSSVNAIVKSIKIWINLRDIISLNPKKSRKKQGMIDRPSKSSFLPSTTCCKQLLLDVLLDFSLEVLSGCRRVITTKMARSSDKERWTSRLLGQENSVACKKSILRRFQLIYFVTVYLMSKNNLFSIIDIFVSRGFFLKGMDDRFFVQRRASNSRYWRSYGCLHNPKKAFKRQILREFGKSDFEFWRFWINTARLDIFENFKLIHGHRKKQARSVNKLRIDENKHFSA